ncbi:AraC family transcriptional regulator [Sphingomonas sp. PAMC 26617]|uniref:AraC family transcriptional regulator n=1 Tax=Sphingomonas sp. PAMC 26617 TaxID=1112216 RepID=UPI00028A414A|nr:AraC family transcriptional regulator [Sphingomonas sp. PAMC 26617]
MIDPLAEVVTLLQPDATTSKAVSGAGAWRLRRTDVGQPFYCVVVEGGCRLEMVGHEPAVLTQGDFVLIPAAHDFTFSSVAPPAPGYYTEPVTLGSGEVRLGAPGEPREVHFLVGHCVFRSPDAALLVSLLPRLVHVRGEARLANLVGMVGDECRETRPARELVLARLLEVLFIEALRSTTSTAASPGLLRGLADPRVASAIRRMHERPGHAWTVAELAYEASLSRSTFFDRFRRTVGTAPMEYLLTWRMALAQNLLRQRQSRIAEVAKLVGYGSASTFSVAFARHVGVPPGQFAETQTRT